MDVLYVWLVAACIAAGAVVGIWRLFAIAPSRQLEIAFFSSGVALSIVAIGCLFSPFHIPYLSQRATNPVEPGNGRAARLTKGAGALRAPPRDVAPENNIQALFRSVRGLDRWTAVYDIAAHTVYLPNGRKLEAHSGLGSRLDNPRYVHERMRGATPPSVYELALREKPFHGIRALRLKPTDGGKVFGRTGLLAHTYMLGPKGDSNGCVVFKDYNIFLQAFETGELNRLAVVARLDTASLQDPADALPLGQEQQYPRTRGHGFQRRVALKPAPLFPTLRPARGYMAVSPNIVVLRKPFRLDGFDRQSSGDVQTDHRALRASHAGEKAIE